MHSGCKPITQKPLSFVVQSVIVEKGAVDQRLGTAYPKCCGRERASEVDSAGRDRGRRMSLEAAASSSWPGGREGGKREEMEDENL